MKKVKYIFAIIFILNVNILAQNTNQTGSNEYNYIYEPEESFDLNDKEAEISFMIERRGLPLVNRLVRFISLTPEIFTFDNEEATVIVPTDIDGKAVVGILPKDTGNGMIAIHTLYVGATGNTNISHEIFKKVNIKPYQKQIKIFSEKVDENASKFLAVTAAPYLFLFVITMFIISYYKHLSRNEKTKASSVAIASLFGMSSIKKKFKTFIIFSFINVLILSLITLIYPHFTAIFLILISLSSFSIKRERVYAIYFLLFSLVAMAHIFTYSITLHTVLSYGVNIAIAKNFIFVFFLFLILTAFFSGIYIPMAIFTFYNAIFALDKISTTAGIAGIFLASIIYIIKYKNNKFNTAIFYTINILKIEE